MGLCPDCENNECLTYATLTLTSSNGSIGITPSIVEGVRNFDLTILGAFELEHEDTTTIMIDGDGSEATPLMASLKLSENPLNILTVDGTGLLALAADLAETPNTKTDTSSIAITLSGTSFRNIQAALKLSATSGNAASMQADGLYVPTVIPVSSRFGKLGEDIIASGNRSFNMATYSYALTAGSDRHFFIDPVARTYNLGDIDGADNGVQLYIDDLNKVIEFNGLGVNFLRHDLINNDHYFGDNSAGSIRMKLLGSTNTAYINAFTIKLGDDDLVGASSHNLFLAIDNPNELVYVRSEGDDYFYIDITQKWFTLGDYDVNGNGSYLDLNDGDSYIDLICGESGGANFSGFNIVPEQLDAYINNGTAVERYTLRENEFEVALVGASMLFSVADGLKVTGDTNLMKTGTTLTNFAGVGAGTLANAPHAGDPDKWISIDDNGTIRKIPTWI